MRIRFVAAQAYGGAFVRSWWPAGALADAGYDARADVRWPDPTDADVVVIHRPLGRDNLARIRSYREMGIRVLVSEDDDLTRLGETENPNRHVVDIEHHLACIAEADGLIVTTRRLVEVYGGLAERTYVCPNMLPSWVATCRMVHPHRWRPPLPRVGWAGTLDSHAHDLRYIRPMVPRVQPEVTFALIGDVRAVPFLGITRFEFRPWVMRLHDLYRYMSDCEVGIVPLAPIGFNLAKSHLKALEYTTLGVPVVVSDLPEQRALVTHGVNGFLAADPAEMADHVLRLVRDPDLRAEMGAAAARIAAERALEKNLGVWLEALGCEAQSHREDRDLDLARR